MAAIPRRVRVPVAVALILQFAAASTCPFCMPSTNIPSLQRWLKSSEHAVLAQTCSPSAVRVTTVVKAAGGFTVGPVITVGGSRKLEAGQDWLALFGADRTEPKLVKLTPSATDFATRFAALPAAPAGVPEAEVARLAFFLAEFGNADRMVAASVMDAFAKAPYDAVKRLRPYLDSEQITNWLVESPPQHRGLLYLLLAVEGSADARRTIAAHFRAEDTHGRAGFDGLIAAVVLLEGKDGLREVLATRPPTTASNGGRIWFANCLLRALEFHVASETVLREDDVYDAVHSLFDDPYAAGPAVGMLIANEHWSSMERVLALHATWGKERPSIDRATRAFLRACGSPEAIARLAELDG